MRFSATRINWITLLSIFTLLTSSVVSSAPLMSFQMLDSINSISSSKSIQPRSSSQQGDCHPAINNDHAQMSHHSSSSDSYLTQSESLHCDSSAESMHNCCTATCVNVIAFIPNSNNDTNFKIRLSKMEALTLGKRVHRPHSLYRPPIA